MAWQRVEKDTLDDINTSFGTLNFDDYGRLSALKLNSGAYIYFDIEVDNYLGVRIYRPTNSNMKIEVCEDLSESEHEGRWSIREYSEIKNSPSVKYHLAEA